MSKVRFRANVELPGAELVAAGVTHVRLVSGGYMITADKIESVRFETYAGVANMQHRANDGGRVEPLRDQVELLTGDGVPLIYGLID